MTIAKTGNGLTLLSQGSSLLLCWDGNTELTAGSGNVIAEVKNMHPSELRELMQSGEKWQAEHDNLRSESIYHEVSSAMQHIKAGLRQ